MNRIENQILIEINQIVDDNKLVSILELIVSKIEINTISEMARLENKTPRGIKVSNQYRKVKIGKQTIIVMVTGKNKEQFEKWYFKNHCKSTMKYDELLPHHHNDVFGWFYNLDLQFQIGVYLAYYDSLPNMTIEICKTPISGKWYYMIDDDSEEKEFANSRNEAYKEALKKADELRNKQLN